MFEQIFRCVFYFYIFFKGDCETFRVYTTLVVCRNGWHIKMHHELKLCMCDDFFFLLLLESMFGDFIYIDNSGGLEERWL